MVVYRLVARVVATQCSIAAHQVTICWGFSVQLIRYQVYIDIQDKGVPIDNQISLHDVVSLISVVDCGSHVPLQSHQGDGSLLWFLLITHVCHTKT